MTTGPGTEGATGQHGVSRRSTDQRRTWSPNRYPVPIREFECDRNNVYGGKLRFFWNVGRRLILGDTAIMVLHKVERSNGPSRRFCSTTTTPLTGSAIPISWRRAGSST